MVGSLESEISDVCQKPDDVDDVINDLDLEDEDVAIEYTQIYLAKVQKRIKEYKITMLNPQREGKKLLVLDIDYTLFDHRSAAESGKILQLFLI